MTTNTKNRLRAVFASSLIGALAASPVGASASCIPTAPTGYEVPVTITTLNKATNVVSYTDATLAMSVSGSTTTWSGTNDDQLFSDRFVPCTTGTFCTQPFDVGQPDLLGVAVKTKGADVTVTMTLESWGDAKFNFSGVCDTKTNLLYGSASWPPAANNAMVLINFGTPFQEE